MITLLQISDIHFSASSVDEDDLNSIKKKFVDDIAAYVDNGHGTFDHILICGDIANTGKQEEYEEAKTFIESIKVRSQCDNVHIVPGNHDMNRKKCTAYRKYLSPIIVSDPAKFISQARNNQLIADILAHYLEPFKNYHSFAERYSSTSIIADKCLSGRRKKINQDDKCYWQHSLGKEDGYEIKLTGVNTALISDCDQKMILPKQMYNIDEHNKEVNFIMAHHPLADIHNGDYIERHLDAIYPLQFYGHRHEQSISKGRTVKLFSGAFGPESSSTINDEDKYSPVYNVVQISVNNDILTIKITSRKWDWDKSGFKMESIPPLKLPLLSGDSWADSDVVENETIIPSAMVNVKKSNANPDVMKMVFGFDKSWALFNNLGREQQKNIMTAVTGSAITSLDSLAKSSFKQRAQGNLAAFSGELIKVLMGKY